MFPNLAFRIFLIFHISCFVKFYETLLKRNNIRKNASHRIFVGFINRIRVRQDNE